MQCAFVRHRYFCFAISRQRIETYSVRFSMDSTQWPMKNSAARTFFALITWLFAFATTLASSSVMNSSAPRQTGTPVVIELFTSEGCSTCPPSDELLARLEEQPFIDGTEVIA